MAVCLKSLKCTILKRNFSHLSSNNSCCLFATPKVSSFVCSFAGRITGQLPEIVSSFLYYFVKEPYRLKRLLAGRWVAQKALRWNVLVWFDEHAVLFTLALLSGFFYKRSG